MKNKKLLWLPVVLLLIVLVLVAGLLTKCVWDVYSEPEGTEPSEGVTQPQQTQPEETEPEETDRIVPPETDPEETELEETEPEETEANSSGTGPNVNTGTGGGYDPGTTDPEATEPEGEVTEPVIEVPPAGSENNAYYENIQDGAGEFTTVKIPAGATVHYRIQTAGKFLRVEDGSAAVVYDGNTYEALEGVVELELPEDDSAPICLTFTNNGEEDKNFPVAVLGPVGSQSNPIAVESLDEIAADLEQDDLDGVFYQWIADRDGMLKLQLETDSDVDVNVLVNDEAAQLTEDNGGKLCTEVEQEDEILVQLLSRPDADGKVPAAQATIKGYIAQMVKLSVMLVPFEAEAVTVEAGQSVYFTVTGANGKCLHLTAENALIYYGEETLLPDENGNFALNVEESNLQIEVCNTADQAATYVLKVNHPAGTILNPQILTQLGDELEARTSASGGHYYVYTAPSAGIVTFQVWTAPENPNAITNIQLTNKTTGETAELADIESTASLPVSAGDELAVCVTVENIAGISLESELTIMGNHYGTEENPIVVEYPGFTAEIPAGITLYYQGYNMNGIIFTLNAADVTVSHNDTEYSGEDISFTAVSQGREPAVFAITNTGTKAAQYAVKLTYPLGWLENPAPLVLGTNTLTQQAGAGDYYYTFTAPKAGKLSLIFDEAAQWTYGINNLTQGIYGDTQWSDSDPLVSCGEISVNKGDQVQIFVNTYDKDNSYENPAGTVVFTARFVTGPVEIANTGIFTNPTLVAGEECEFVGSFYGLTMRITGDSNATVVFDGRKYQADSSGTITIEMPASGTQQQSFVLRNGNTKQVTYTITFSTKDVGSADNPEKLTVGSYSMVQSIKGGNDHYYKFVATTTQTLTFTFETDVDCIFIVNGTTVRYTHMGQNTYSIRVRPGAVINLVVNTYDPANPMVSPVGTVDFTVSLK